MVVISSAWTSARQRGRDAVRIDRVVVEAFRLEEDLVPLAIGEAHHLVLDRRAVAHARGRDLARIHRRAMQVGADQRVGRGVGMGDPAGDLRVGHALGQERERHRRIVARLTSSPARSMVRPSSRGGVPVLSRPRRKPEAQQALGEPMAGRVADPAGRPALLAEMDLAAQEGAGGQDRRAPARKSVPSGRRRRRRGPPSTIRSSTSASRSVEAGLGRRAARARPARRACGRPARAAPAPPAPCCG